MAASGKPILVRPDGKVVQLKVEGHVPVLDDSCKVFTKERFSEGRASQEIVRNAADEDQLDELVSDDACHEYLRRRKTEDLISEAASAQHQFTHFYKVSFLQNLPACKDDGSTCSSEAHRN